MAEYTNLDFSEGYLKCLADLNEHTKGKKTIEIKKLNDEFAVPKMEHHNKRIGDIMDEWSKEYNAHENLKSKHKPKT